MTTRAEEKVRHRTRGTRRSGPKLRFHRPWQLVLGLAAVVLCWYARHLLLLVFAGVLLAIFLQTAAQWLGKVTPLRYGWALGATVGVWVGLLTAVILLFGARVAQETAQLSETLPGSIEHLRQKIEQTEWGRGLMKDLPPITDLVANRQALAQVSGIAASTANAFVGLLVILFVGLYGAAAPQMYLRGLLHLVPRRKRERAEEVALAVVHNLRWWMFGHLVTMSIVGTATGVGLWLLGVPQALVLGIIAFFAELVPNIGPIVAAIPAVLLAWTQSTSLALWVIALYAIVQLAESYLVLPLVMRQAVDLPPALTIVAVVFFGLIAGLVGALVATPLALTILLLVKMLYVEDVLGSEA